MNEQDPNLTDLEQTLRSGGWQWSDPPETPSRADLAAWVESPTEHEEVESLLAADPAWRHAVVDMRVGGLELDADLDPDLMVRLTGLMPDPPTVLARIGGWALAAAACILLAIAGWQLGSETASERSMEQALAIATFGLSEDESGDGSFLAVTFGEGEDDR
ncbi:MAG: hypothetical protein QF561_02025 [Phycisphaerales bacterium]|nr:hypothetical protein [Phycisphaerales bacterium]